MPDQGKHPIESLESLSLSAFLRQAAERVAALGAEFEASRSRLEDLQRRLLQECCYLAVLGQFKRGKSTLINALLGEAVLPAAVVPLTSIPTFLYAGEQVSARVVFDNDKAEERFTGPGAAGLAEFLARFVTESANPHNRLGVELVEVTHPAAVLSQGVALIDTPGIGSTFRHNTEATVNFLPQCDAALFVVSADPPITEVEVEFLKLAKSKLARLFFILNKVDYLNDEERAAAVAFLKQVLAEKLGYSPPPPIFCVSARKGLSSRQERDEAAWQGSGMAEIEQRIVRFLLTEKTGVLNQALWRQADDVLGAIQRRMELGLRSLHLPLGELDKRIGLFEEKLGRIEEQRIVAMERLSREEERLTHSVKKHADQLLPKSVKFLKTVTQASENQHGLKWSEELAREAIAAAIPGFFEREFGLAHQLCEEELREALLPHLRHAADLIASVHRLVEKLFDMPFEPREEEVTLASTERPYWRTHKWVISLGPAIPVTWIDKIVTQRQRHARIRRRIMEQVEYLVTRNVGDLKSSILQNLERSVQSVRDTLNDGLKLAIQATREALETARRRRTEGAEAVAPEVARFKGAISDLQALRAAPVKK